MKIFTTLLFLLGFLTVMGQEPIEVKTEERPSSLGVQTAFEVVVPQATPGDAIDLWKKTILPRGLFKKSPKMEKVKDEWIVRNLLISDITTLPLNVITQVSSFPGHIYVRIFLQTEGGFLGSSGASPQTTDAAIKYIRNYGVDLYRLAVGKELKEEENKLQALENDLNKLMRKNKSYDSKIADAQKDKADLADEASYRKQLLEGNTGSPLGVIGETPRADVEDELKATEKELKKAAKTESRFEKKTRRNEKEQQDKAYEIEKQKIKIQEVKIKLDNIR